MATQKDSFRVYIIKIVFAYKYPSIGEEKGDYHASIQNAYYAVEALDVEASRKGRSRSS